MSANHRHHHHHYYHQMPLPLRSFIHSFTHLNIYKGFLWLPFQGMTPRLTKLPTGSSLIPSFRSPYLTSAKTVNDHILLLLLLNFLFNTYNRSSSSSHHHLPPGLLKQPPTSHPFSNLFYMYSARVILHELPLPSEDMLLLSCLKR